MYIDYSQLNDELRKKAEAMYGGGSTNPFYQRYLATHQAVTSPYGDNTAPLTPEDFAKSQTQQQEMQYLRDTLPDIEKQTEERNKQENSDWLKAFRERVSDVDLLKAQVKARGDVQKEQDKIRNNPKYIDRNMVLRSLASEYGYRWDDNRNLDENVANLTNALPPEKQVEFYQRATSALMPEKKTKETDLMQNTKYVAQILGIPERDALDRVQEAKHKRVSRDQFQMEAYQNNIKAGYDSDRAMQAAEAAGKVYDQIAQTPLQDVASLEAQGPVAPAETPGGDMGAIMPQITREQAIAELRRRGRL